MVRIMLLLPLCPNTFSITFASLESRSAKSVTDSLAISNFLSPSTFCAMLPLASSTTAKNALSGIKPTGWSPIAKSLYDVKEDLADKDGKNYVYIVTDGEEISSPSVTM